MKSSQAIACICVAIVGLTHLTLNDSFIMHYYYVIACSASEVSWMVVSAGAWMIGSVIRMIIALPIVVVLVLFFWKLGKLADAYAEELRSKSWCSFWGEPLAWLRGTISPLSSHVSNTMRTSHLAEILVLKGYLLSK